MAADVDELNVFISWSGDRSKAMAAALHNWLPFVLHRAKPWMSTEIQAGALWRKTLAERLDAMNFGILCVTPENQHAPWLLFEAGALSKRFEEARVCPVVHASLPLSSLKEPLAAFNARQATMDGLFSLVSTLNALLGEHALSETKLRKTFDAFWESLNKELAGIPGSKATAPRPMMDKIDEILLVVRSLELRQAGYSPESLRGSAAPNPPSSPDPPSESEPFSAPYHPVYNPKPEHEDTVTIINSISNHFDND